MNIETPIFDVAYYINLSYRVDRRNNFEAMAKFLPVQKVVRFEAINGNTMDQNNWPGTAGALGIRESHIQLLELAKKKNHQLFFVFEDDAVIKKTFSKKFYHLLDEIDDDWDMIYLYAKNHFMEPIKISNKVIQLQNT